MSPSRSPVPQTVVAKMHRTAHAWARRRCKECPLVFARASGAKPARRERNSQQLAPWNACLAPRALQRPRYQLTSALHVPWQRSKASRRLNPHKVVQWCCISEALQAFTKMKRAASLASNARLALLPYCWGPKQERVEAPLASFFFPPGLGNTLQVIHIGHLQYHFRLGTKAQL